ncbi:hypothetical protein Sjap_017202 [Stephania japonica]|uniref:Diacylglycerol O-acyltransferase n=1 Tax=Stephania japonica TaxID=461633 RepID=A0AAP0I5Q2_9MAGN
MAMKKMELSLGGEKEEISFPPLSPVSAALTTFSLSLSILPVFKFNKVLINEASLIELLRNEIMPFNDRLSSIVHTDKKGVKRWRKVDFSVEDLLVIPTFPSGLSPEECDQHLHKYLSKIGTERFPMDRPLWEVHVITYPTTSGGGAVVFKFCHAIGDGYSLVSLLMKVLRRADDPSLPLSFPNITLRSKIVRKNNGFSFALKCFNTVSDVVAMVGRSMWLKDHKTATVNDVITGIIHYAIHLYMFKKEEDFGGERMTSLTMLNLRSLRGFNNVDEMVKAGIWGNSSITLCMPIPTFVPKEHIDRDPLEFIERAKESMKRIRDSALVQIIMPVIKKLNHMKGAEAVAEFISSTMKNNTTLITNVIGPNEKMAMAGYPVGDFFYFVTGIPQA